MISLFGGDDNKREEYLFDNINELHILNQSIHEIKSFHFSNNLRKLYLIGNNINECSELKYCRNIEELVLDDNCINNLNNLPLKSLINLRSLSINNNKLYNLNGISISKLLKKLSCANNRISKIGNSLNSLLYLEELNIAGNDIYCLNELLSLACLPSLKSLWLNDSLYGANPICKTQTDGYKVLIILCISHLKYLDGQLISTDKIQATNDEFYDRLLYYTVYLHTIKQQSKHVSLNIHETMTIQLSLLRDKIAELCRKLLTESNDDESKKLLIDNERRLMQLENAYKEFHHNVYNFEDQMKEIISLQLESVGTCNITYPTNTKNSYSSIIKLLNKRLLHPTSFGELGLKNIEIHNICQIFNETREVFYQNQKHLTLCELLKHHCINEIEASDARNSIESILNERYLFVVNDHSINIKSFIDICRNGFDDMPISLCDRFYFCDWDKNYQANDKDISLKLFHENFNVNNNINDQITKHRVIIGKMCLSRFKNNLSTSATKHETLKLFKRDEHTSGNMYHLSDGNSFIPLFIVELKYIWTKSSSSDINLQIKDQLQTNGLDSLHPVLRNHLSEFLLRTDNNNHDHHHLYEHNNFDEWHRMDEEMTSKNSCQINFMRSNEWLHLLQITEKLLHLNLQFNSIEQFDINIIHNIPTLQTLNLSHNMISNILFSATKTHPSLTHINLSYNNISDAYIIYCLMRQCPYIINLSLKGNPIAAISTLKRICKISLLRLCTKYNDRFRHFVLDTERMYLENILNNKNYTIEWTTINSDVFKRLTNKNLNDGNDKNDMILWLTNSIANKFSETNYQYHQQFKHVDHNKQNNNSNNNNNKQVNNNNKQVNNNNKQVNNNFLNDDKNMSLSTNSCMFTLNASNCCLDTHDFETLQQQLNGSLNTSIIFKVELNDNFLTNLNCLSLWASIRWLDLRSNLLNNCNNLIKTLLSLKNLYYLNLSNNKLTTKNCDNISKLLVSILILDHNYINTLKPFHQMNNLRMLSLLHNNIGDDNWRMQHIMNELEYLAPNYVENLNVLNLNGNPISNLENYRGLCIYLISQLQVLDCEFISNNDYEKYYFKYHGALKLYDLENVANGIQLKDVIKIDLSTYSNPLRSIDIIKSTLLPNLQYLNLDNNKIRDIECMGELPYLKVLKVNNNEISTIPHRSNHNKRKSSNKTKYLANIFPSLEILELGYNRINCINDLSLCHMNKLKVLILSGNNINSIDNGLEGLISIKHLILSNNIISNIEPSAFMDLKSLRGLKLDNNHLRSAAIHIITSSQLVNLRYLYLDHNRISQIGLGACFSVEICTFSHNLLRLSLNNNPVARRHLYRSSVISKLPALIDLDNRSVTPEEHIKSELLHNTNTNANVSLGINQQVLIDPKIAPWAAAVYNNNVNNDIVNNNNNNSNNYISTKSNSSVPISYVGSVFPNVMSTSNNYKPQSSKSRHSYDMYKPTTTYTNNSNNNNNNSNSYNYNNRITSPGKTNNSSVLRGTIIGQRLSIKRINS